jgi:hypothetical protein
MTRNPADSSRESPELHELVAAWLGEEVSEERAAELFARLRDDAELRRAFVAETRMLSMLRVVQAPEPRWLALQDELGLLERPARSFDQRLRQVLLTLPRRAIAPWWRTAAWVAAGVAAGLAAIAFWPSPPPSTRSVEIAPAPAPLAIVVRSEGVRWANGQTQRPGRVEKVVVGRLAFNAGQLTLALLNGVSLHLEGPADLTLLSHERVVCRSGRLRVHVPAGAEGFTVETPGAAVTDLGTEFGIEVGQDGKTEVVVYQGQAEASLLSSSGQPQRTQVIDAPQAWKLDPKAGRMLSVAPREQLAAPNLALPPLPLGEAYSAAVLATGPRHYWRGAAVTAGVVADAGFGKNALRILGPVSIGSDGSFVFRQGSDAQCLATEQPLTPPDAQFAIEFWFASESFHSSALAVLHTSNPYRDLALVELTHRHLNRPVRPGEVRFLYRWPPGGIAGHNVFSSDIYSPYHWHHLVAQRRANRLELYLDGSLAGVTPLPTDQATAACQLLFGRRRDPRESYDPRQFHGRMAELAIYDRALTVAEIQAHAGARTPP